MARYWAVQGQTVASGTPLNGEAVDCSNAQSVSFFYQYTQATSGPTIDIDGSWDGGNTWITLKALTPGTGTGVTASLTWVGTAVNEGTPTVTEAPAVPAPLMRMTVTAASLNNVTAGTFAVIPGGR
ncbi:MAG: hypothetical protein KC729_00090 [Candidatus Eisenbacteria bacterium]|uniref:Uncharacterized protein n=1 Tax=Eiseniibacteriota bacterium TaxID=2212470 RepID=A0A956LV54_UNCEI|nr:hypothetical protein [Candidatus Eisenbacteria bacterium]